MSDLKKEIERIIAENDIDAYDMKSLRDMTDALEAMQKHCAGLERADKVRRERIAKLESALRYIAEYAHPDFPADDLAGEFDRAETIWLQFQNVASFALKGQDDK